jgi:hypothetical protein
MENDRRYWFPAKRNGWDGGVLRMVVILMLICYAKGERPRWRWGR